MQYTELTEHNPKTVEKLAKKTPIRILHVVGGMVRAGTETWLMHILRNIDRNAFQMDFLVHTNQECDYDAEIRALGSKVIPCLNSSQPWLYARNFSRILRENEPYDIVHSHVHHFSGLVLWLAKRAGIPVRIAHSHLDSSVVESNSGLKRSFYTGLSKALIGKSATVGLGCSKYAAIDLFGKNCQTDSRWQVLYCGIDLAPFAQTVDSQSIRSELGIPEDAFVIGHVGRFEEQKNHKFLIEIASEIAKQEALFRLVLLGEGKLRQQIEQKVIQLGLDEKVIFAGTRSDIPRLMLGAMDVLLFPSLYEGLPVVGLEAQAAELPLVISDVVSPELDQAKWLIHRLNLSQPASVWAQTVLSIRDRKSKVAYSNKSNVLESSQFNIRQSKHKLTNIYEKEVNKSYRNGLSKY